MIDLHFDPVLDLKIERMVSVAPDLIWRAWTEPKHLVHWFTPAPWRTTACEIDLWPGGKFRTVMEGPDGEKVDSTGCILLVERERQFVFTDAVHPGFRPKEAGFMTSIITIEPHGPGTKYIAIAKHKDEADRKAHEEMGFESGWGKALDQLVDYVSML